MKLYSYFRSSASYRVRAALNLKGLAYDYVPIHLNRNGGEQFSGEFQALNPQALVPVLVDGGVRISQSLAIIEYLNERYPQPSLLPENPADRAYVRQLALAIACDIHPINNLRVLRFLSDKLAQSTEAKDDWVRHWITVGFDALETELSGSVKRGRFCFGDTPTVADCCLIPQIFNATRFGVDMARYPTLSAIERSCNALLAFKLARPDKQSDAESLPPAAGNGLAPLAAAR